MEWESFRLVLEWEWWAGETGRDSLSAACLGAELWPRLGLALLFRFWLLLLLFSQLPVFLLFSLLVLFLFEHCVAAAKWAARVPGETLRQR